MTQEQLTSLVAASWRLTRDGSTATAQFVWEDPDDPDSSWEILVLYTTGHGARLTVNVEGSGLSERSPTEAALFGETVHQAISLVNDWNGELAG